MQRTSKNTKNVFKNICYYCGQFTLLWLRKLPANVLQSRFDKPNAQTTCHVLLHCARCLKCFAPLSIINVMSLMLYGFLASAVLLLLRYSINSFTKPLWILQYQHFHPQIINQNEIYLIFVKGLPYCIICMIAITNIMHAQGRNSGDRYSSYVCTRFASLRNESNWMKKSHDAFCSARCFHKREIPVSHEKKLWTN
jgi:hypothetical protein